MSVLVRITGVLTTSPAGISGTLVVQEQAKGETQAQVLPEGSAGGAGVDGASVIAGTQNDTVIAINLSHVDEVDATDKVVLKSQRGVTVLVGSDGTMVQVGKNNG